MTEPRVDTVEGRRTIVQPVGHGLPGKLPDLLGQLLQITFAEDVVLQGARATCEAAREHRLTRFREGRWFARDGVRRGEFLDLSLRMCRDCGAVQVRDVSFDLLPGQRRPAAGPPKRRDHVIGWYSGKRRAGREYK